MAGSATRGWWAEEDFWKEMFDFIFPPENLAEGERVAREAAALLALRAGAAVLDLACGPGRVAVPLARGGYRVTGLDQQPWFLEQARARAGRDRVALALRHGDIAEERHRPEHDAVLCLFNSFGYFADPLRDARILDRAFEALRPGGRFLLEVAHRDGVVRTLHVREATAPDGRRWREEPRFDLVSGVLVTRWTVTSAAGTHSYVARTRPYTATELRDMLRAAGFHRVRFHGGLDDSPPSLDRYMLVAVAER